MPAKARQPLSLKARAIGLLAQREHSRLELRRKLLAIERRARAASTAGRVVDEEGEADAASCLAETDATAADDFAPSDAADDPDTECITAESRVDALLDDLAAAGYLDETRFVESRVHLRASRFGVQRIQQELAQHGLKLDADQQDALRASELERARDVWTRRFGLSPSREPAEQARQGRFLLARGFSPDLVRRLLRTQGSVD